MFYVSHVPRPTYTRMQTIHIFPYGCCCPPSHCQEPMALYQCGPAHTLFILSLALSLFLPNGGGTQTLGIGAVKPLSSPLARFWMMRGRGEQWWRGRPPWIGLARPRRVPQMRCSFHKDSEQAIGQLSQLLRQVLREHQGVYYVLQIKFWFVMALTRLWFHSLQDGLATCGFIVYEK